MKAATPVATLLLLFIIMPLGAQESLLPDPPTGEFAAELTALPGPVSAGDTLTAVLVLRMPEGWHTYWTNPGDTGAAAVFDWDLPEGWIAGEPRWPLPEAFSEGESVSYGFDGVVTVLVPISVGPWPRSDSAAIHLRLEWLTCADICVARYDDLEFLVTTDDENRYRSAIPLPPAPIDVRIDAEGSTLRLLWDGDNGGIQPENLWFFASSWGSVEPSAPQSWKTSDGKIQGELRRGVVPTDRLEGLLVTTENGEPIAGYVVDSIIRFRE